MTNLVNAYTQVQNQPVSYKGKRAKYSEVEKLLKYVNDESLTSKPDTFSSTAKSAASSAMMFEGIPFVNMLRKNKALSGKFYSDGMRELQTNLKTAKKALFNPETGKFTTRIKNYMTAVTENQKNYSALKSSVASQYKTKLAEDAAKKAAQGVVQEVAEQAVKKAPSKMSKAANLIAKPFKAVGNGIKSAGTGIKTGFRSLGGKIGKGMPQGVRTAGGKLGGWLKTSGAGFMLAIDGVMETFSEVVPTFKELGAKKGWKQAGKSAVKVVGNTAGYILGAKAGAAIGSFICPGIGTAVGAACGFVGGIIGQFITGKITKKIVGPSEREKAHAEQQKQAIAEIAKDPQAMEELKALALAKIQQEAQYTGGELSKDSRIALRTIENIEKSNPFSAVV